MRRPHLPVPVKIAALLALLVGGYLAADHSGRKTAESDQPSTPVLGDGAGGPGSEDAALEMVFVNDLIFCDGTAHPLGQIRGAEPGERIVLSSALPVDLAGGEVADEQGRYDMTWACDQSEARLRWDIMAVGNDTGRRVEFTIRGSAEDPARANDLLIDVDPEPFPCDGVRRDIGLISDALPFEVIGFASPQAAAIRPGQADADGELVLKWRCTQAESGTVWVVTATGEESGKSGRFTVTGRASVEGPDEQLVVEVFENPFACDGMSREFALLSNLVPFEVVDFSSDQASGLIDGRADDQGELPVRWQCGLDDVGKTWSLTAMGVNSGRSTTLTFSGGQPRPGTLLELEVAYSENPFACDGSSRAFAMISNFASREYVDFTSPQSQGLRQGQADDSGTLAVRWQCVAADIGTIWDLTATGATSNRSTTLQVVGAAP